MPDSDGAGHVVRMSDELQKQRGKPRKRMLDCREEYANKIDRQNSC